MCVLMCVCLSRAHSLLPPYPTLAHVLCLPPHTSSLHSPPSPRPCLHSVTLRQFVDPTLPPLKHSLSQCSQCSISLHTLPLPLYTPRTLKRGHTSLIKHNSGLMLLWKLTSFTQELEDGACVSSGVAVRLPGSLSPNPHNFPLELVRCHVESPAVHTQHLPHLARVRVGSVASARAWHLILEYSWCRASEMNLPFQYRTPVQTGNLPFRTGRVQVTTCSLHV